MPYFRRNRSQRLKPVHSIKHIVDKQGGVVLNVKENITVASGVDAPTLAVEEECEVGSKVFALYLNIQVNAETEAALGNIYMIIYKNPGGNVAAGNIPNGNVTGASDFKRQIFHTEMRMMSNSANTKIPITVFNGVIRIPRTFNTMRINDVIQVQLFAPGVNFNYCFQCIFKEFR